MIPHADRLLDLIRTCRSTVAASPGRAAARMGIIDCVGCIVAGSSTETAGIVRKLASEQGDRSQASLFGTDLKLSPPLAALANGVAGHVLDYDDMSATIIGHPSVVLVPVVFALGESMRHTGSRIVDAYMLGFEIDMYFGRLMLPHHYDAGWHTTSSLGIFGAAAAASQLLGLDALASLNAMAICASNVAGLRANFGSMTKSLHAGHAAEGGVRAALLSSRGFTANANVFDVDGGFFSAFGTDPAPAAPPAHGSLEIDATGIGIKAHACCGAGVSVVDAAIEIHREHAPDPARIEAVECIVSEMATRIMPFRRATDGLQAKYCLEYCAAVGLIDGRGGLSQFHDERVRHEDVQQLAHRVHVRSDAAMASGSGRFGVRMTVHLREGREVSTELTLPLGHPQRPMSSEALLGKFYECTGAVLGEARARQAATKLHGLEDEPDLLALAALLRPAANP